MAKIAVSLKIDVKKLDKSRFFHGKDGAVYVDLTTFMDLDNKGQYGDNGFVTQSPTKEERAQKTQLPILGNSTVFWTDGAQAPAQQAPQQQAPQQAPPEQDFDQDIPF